MKRLVIPTDHTTFQRVIITLLGILMYAALLTSCSSGLHSQCSAYDETQTHQLSK